jgi:hypothetical protein
MALKNVFNFHNMKRSFLYLFVYYTLWTNQDLFHQIIILSSLKYIYSKQFVSYDEVGLASVAKWSKSLTYYYQLIINGGTSPRNEKLNLLVQIKFLNLFYIYLYLNKNWKHLLVWTKVYWSWGRKYYFVVDFCQMSDSLPLGHQLKKLIGSIDRTLLVIHQKSSKSANFSSRQNHFTVFKIISIK